MSPKVFSLLAAAAVLSAASEAKMEIKIRISFKPRATKQQLLDAMKGHIVGEAALVGRYAR